MDTGSTPGRVLDAALSWAHDCLQLARDQDPRTPTPCSDWDLGRLLAHMDDSLVAMAEAAELGQISIDPLPLREHGSLVDRVERRGCRLRQQWHERVTSAPVLVGGLTLGRETLQLVGALEIAVHGWDLARASGADRDLPEELALQLLDVAAAVVTEQERGRRFAAPLATGLGSPAGTRLLAHLGRAATWSRPTGPTLPGPTLPGPVSPGPVSTGVDGDTDTTTR